MKRITVAWAVIAAVIFSASVAAASTVTVSRTAGYFATADPGSGGGEFTAKDASGTLLTPLLGLYDIKAKPLGGIQTFCIELSEHIAVPGTYNATIDDVAKLGGNAAHGGPNDPISVGSAYLYSLFARGVLAGYNYTAGAGRAASAGLLQEAIWVLEMEILTDPGSNLFVNAAIAKFGTLGDPSTGARKNQAPGQFYVKALNLTATDAAGTLVQSHLVYVPDGGLTVMLLGIGVSGLALIRRKLT